MRVDTKQAVASIRDLKDNISSLKAQLSELTVGTDAYKNTLAQLNVSQNLLRGAMNGTTASMEDLTNAANGAGQSYNGLVNQMAAMRKELRNIDVSTKAGQKQFNELAAKINGVNTRLKEMDAATGNYQRNVGNYAGAVRGLNLAMAQVVRELPSLTMGADMFFLAISNNLPILADNIQLVREQNAKMLAETGKAPKLITQVVKSLFSWNSLMSVAITLLTLFGGKIIDWVSGLFKAKEETDAAAKAQEELNKAMQDMAQAEVKATASAKTYYSIATDVTRSMEDRLGAAQKLIKEYPQYLSDFSEEEVIAGKAADAYGRLSLSLQEAARAKAAMQKITENYSKILDLQIQLEEKTEALNNAKDAMKYLDAASKAADASGQNNPVQAMGTAYSQQFYIDEYKKYEKAAKDLEEDTESLTNQIEELTAVNTALQSKISLTSEYLEGQADAAKKAADELERLKAAADKAVKWEFEGLQDLQDIEVPEIQDWENLENAFNIRIEGLERYRDAYLAYNNAIVQDETNRAQKEYEINQYYDNLKLQALIQYRKDAEAIGDTSGAEQATQEIYDLNYKIWIDSLNRKKEIDEETVESERRKWSKIIKIIQTATSAFSGLFDGIADVMESNGDESAAAQERIKNMRIAAATIDTIGGAIGAYMQASQSIPPPWGQIVGAVAAAGVVATGIAQINKIKQTDVSGSSSSSGSISSPAAVQAPTISPQFNQVRNITGASEEERLNRMAGDQRVYVLESDIEAARNSRRVKVEESTF